MKWASARSAIKRLEDTLIWRREYGVYDMITADHVEPEVSTYALFALERSWTRYVYRL